MATERVRALIDDVGPLPVMPALADELLGLAVTPDADVRRIQDVVERDPVLTAMVLRLVNSASFGMRRRIGDVSHAVVLLGVSHVRSLALAASMSTTFQRTDDAPDRWQHAFCTASASRIIADQLCPELTETAFAAGMLHDIGELILSAMVDGPLPWSPEPVIRLAEEYGRVGADHAELGAALAERWSIPTLLVDAIAHHHDWEVFSTGRLGLDGIVAVSELVMGDVGGRCDAGDEDAAPLLAQLGAPDPERLAAETRTQVAAQLAAITDPSYTKGPR